MRDVRHVVAVQPAAGLPCLRRFVRLVDEVLRCFTVCLLSSCCSIDSSHPPFKPPCRFDGELTSKRRYQHPILR